MLKILIIIEERIRLNSIYIREVYHNFRKVWNELSFEEKKKVIFFYGSLLLVGSYMIYKHGADFYSEFYKALFNSAEMKEKENKLITKKILDELNKQLPTEEEIKKLMEKKAINDPLIPHNTKNLNNNFLNKSIDLVDLFKKFPPKPPQKP